MRSPGGSDSSVCAKLALFFQGWLNTGKPLAKKNPEQNQKIPSLAPLCIHEPGTGTRLRSEGQQRSETAPGQELYCFSLLSLLFKISFTKMPWFSVN